MKAIPVAAAVLLASTALSSGRDLVGDVSPQNCLARATPPEMRSFCQQAFNEAPDKMPADCAGWVNPLTTGVLPESAGCCAVSPTAGGMVAREADQFVDSLGVVLKLGDGKSYSAAAMSRLGELGVRHVRGALRPAAKHADEVRAIARQYGIKFTLLVNGYHDSQSMSGSEAHEAVLRIGTNVLDGLEGENEPEFNRGSPEQARAHQIDLYSAIKGDPRTSDVMVFGPSVSAVGIAAGKARQIGDISKISDGTNVHSYPHPWGGAGGLSGVGYSNPELVGGTLLGSFDAVQQMGGVGKPLIGTETGYPTIDAAFPNPNKTKAIYMPRLFLTLFNHGMDRAYSYDFIDANTDRGGDRENNFGYLESNLSPKESFYTMKNLAHTLADPGPRFTPASADFSINGGGPNLNSTLLEKRDGSFWLALWIGKKLDLGSPAHEQVTISGSVASATLLKLDGSSSPVSVSNGAINAIVGDEVSIFRIVPAGKGKPCEATK